MRDYQTPGAADDCPDAARDLLPALLHGRTTGAERALAESHLAGCAACAAELALLGEARTLLVASAPAINLAAIASAVRAATVAPATHVMPVGDRQPVETGLHVASASHPASLTRASRWRAARSWRALTATLLLTVGSGAVVVGRGLGRTPTANPAPAVGVGADPVEIGSTAVTASRPAAAVVAPVSAAGRPTTQAPPALLAAVEPSLGTGFDDLSDDELQVVLDAVTGDEGALPNAEPEAAALTIEVGSGR